MIHSAVVRAEEMRPTNLRRFEAFGRVLAGHDVSLDAKRRDENVVNHVFSRHDQFDLPADGHMQFVDLSLAGVMLKLPHPLLTDEVNLSSVLRWTILGEINLRAPRENAHRND